MFDSLLFSGKYQEAVEVVTVVTVTEVTVFLEGINVGIRELMDCKYVYIDYKYIINIYIYNLFLKTEEVEGGSENCNFCNRNRFYRKITLPRTTGELLGKHRETLGYS